MIKTIIPFFTLFVLFLNPSFGQRAAELLDSITYLEKYPGDSIIILELEKVSTIARSERDDTTLAMALIYLSPIYFDLDYLYDHEQVVIESAEVIKRDANFSSWIPSSVSNNIAVLEQIKGNYHLAIDHCLNAIELEKSNSNDLGKLASIYSNIAIYYEQVGDFENSLDFIEQAIKYYNSSHTIVESVSLYGLHSLAGWAAYSKGDNKLSRNYYNTAQSIYNNLSIKEKSTKVDHSINNLQRKAILDLSEGKDIQTILGILNKLQTENGFRTFRTYMIAGSYFQTKGENIKSIQSYDNAIKSITRKKNSIEVLSFLQQAYYGKSESFYTQKSYNQSLSTSHAGLMTLDSTLTNNKLSNPSLKSFDNYPVAIDLLQLKAKSALKVYQNTKDISKWEVCQKTYMHLCSLLAEMKNQFLANQSKFFVAKNAQPIYEEIMDVFVNQYAQSSTDKLLDDILYVMQSNKSIILFDAVKRKIDLIASDIPKEDINKLVELRNKESFYQEILSKEETKSAPDQSIIEKLKSELFMISEDQELHNKKMLDTYPEYVAQKKKQLTIPTKEEIWNEMNYDEALLMFFKGLNDYYLVEILKGEISLRTIDSTLISEVKHYQSLASNLPKTQNAFLDFTKTSQKIGKSLLTNIKKKDIKTISIIPDGFFSSIPFEAMIVDDAYAVEKWNVSYLLSLQQYLDTKTNAREKSNATVFCLAPDFSELEYKNEKSLPQGLQSLPFAKEEANFLSGIFDSKVKSDNTTFTTDLMEYAKNYSIIHLATHAVVHENDAMLSEIYFNDGPLTIFDIQELEIETEFVMLSACNTAVGSTKEGEGVISLSRGFFQAGVQSVQSSLWPLDDYSSSEIVKEMYTNLKSGQKKSEALRNSKLDYLSKADKLHRHPYFWAGIVHVGDDSPLFSSFNYNYLLLFFLILASIIGLFLYSKKG